MSDAPVPAHPPEFRALCREAASLFESLPSATQEERTRRLPEIRRLLERIHQQAEALDLRAPGFATEQGLLVDASSALQSIDIDRGGPRVPHWVERAVADLRRLEGG